MPNPVTGLIVGGTSLLGGALQSNAAKKAGQAQANANAQGIEEQRRQFDALQKLLAPYVEAGTGALPGMEAYGQYGMPALTGQADILGLNGEGAQGSAISGIENSPLFQSLARQGEDAILQNASATGGLRGGNVQGALAQFRPAMLQQLIDQQYGRLGGMAGFGAGINQNLVSMGQSSAAGVGNAGMQSANSIGTLLQDTGAAKAGAKIASGQAWGNVLNMPAQFLGLKMGMGKGAGGLVSGW